MTKCDICGKKFSFWRACEEGGVTCCPECSKKKLSKFVERLNKEKKQGESVKSYVERLSKEREQEGDVKSYKNKKWIEVFIFLDAPIENLVRDKRIFKEYAAELGWVTKFESDAQDVTIIGLSGETKIKYYSLRIEPHGGRISPQKLYEESDKLKGLSAGLMRDLGITEAFQESANISYQALLPWVDKKPTKKDFSNKKPAKKDFYLTHLIGPLVLRYRVYDRMMLEKNNKKLSDELFHKVKVMDIMKSFLKDEPEQKKIMGKKKSGAKLIPKEKKVIEEISVMNENLKKAIRIAFASDLKD